MAGCGSFQLNGADLPCVMSDVRDILRVRLGGREGSEGKGRRWRIWRIRVSWWKNMRLFERKGRRNPAVNPVFPSAVYRARGGICLGRGLKQRTPCVDHNYTAVCWNDPHAYSPPPPTTFTKRRRRPAELSPTKSL